MRKRTLLLAALPALALTACVGTGTENRGLESVHQPVVAHQDYTLDVTADYRGLASGEAYRLDGWLASLELGYGDRVAVDDPSGSGAVRRDVAQHVARYGLLVADGAPITGEPVRPGTARVVVSRREARVPGCPDWSRMGGSDFNANTGSNYGCALNSNLAAMVANPDDLVHGRDSGGYDAAQGTKAIDVYRKAVPSGNGGAPVRAPTTSKVGGGQ